MSRTKAENQRQQHPVVLVVDDNPQNRELLQAYLEDVDCHTVPANDGLEALQILASSLERAADARVMLTRILAQHGVTTAVAIPDISTKAAAQAAVGLDAAQMEADKKRFLETLVPQWDAEYEANHGSGGSK